MNQLLIDEDLTRRLEELRERRGDADIATTLGIAIESEFERLARTGEIAARNAGVLQKADALGQSDPNFSLKHYTDAQWSDA